MAVFGCGWTNPIGLTSQKARANVWAVCLPSYILAPEVRFSEMTLQIGAAISEAASRIAGPIHISGHSAGGHLATRMISADSSLHEAARADKAHAIDLRPLMHNKMNNVLRIDEAEALR